MLEKVTIRVDKDEWKKFKRIAAEQGFNASSILRNFIKEYIKTKENREKPKMS